MITLENKMKIIGKNIRSFREKHGWSRGDFSKIMNLSVTHLYRLEKGMNTFSAPIIIKLSKKLKTTPNDLFKGCF